ncbi:MAG: RNA polymerase sigma factor [Longimicrobiales bacterium]
MKEHSDAELVGASVRGNSEAFGELVRRYQRAAYSVALAVTGKHQDAEDAAQESFIVALERLEDCRDPDRFAGWLLTTVRNRAKNLIRRESLRSTAQIPPGTVSKGRGPAGESELVSLRARLEAALATVTDIQREIVLLHDLEGWKHNEISGRLGIPSGTVRSHLHFARKALRAEMSEWKNQEEAV